MTTQNNLARRPTPTPSGGGTSLAAQVAPGEWSRAYLDTIKATYGRNLTDAEFALAVQVSKTTGLRIDNHELWCYRRGQGEPLTLEISVDGFRAIAHTSGQFAGEEGPLYCGPDGVWQEVWLDTTTPPAAAKCIVWRKDFPRPFTAVVLMREFRVLGGKSPVWGSIPVHMLGLRAAKHAFRKAFRQEIASRERTVLDSGAALSGDDGSVEPPAMADAPSLPGPHVVDAATAAISVVSAVPVAPAPDPWRADLVARYQAAWDQIQALSGRPPRASREVDDSVPDGALQEQVDAGERWVAAHQGAAHADEMITAPTDADDAALIESEAQS